MTSRHFMELLRARMSEGLSLCVGLDSDITKLPKQYAKDELPQFMFNTDVIDATHGRAVAFKLNIAFYADDAEGRKALHATIAYIKQVAPGVPIILDAKRGDIGNTNVGYVHEAFEWFGADAMTVSPYLGFGDAVNVFTTDPTKGVIVLCRTSNPGAGEFQDRQVLVNSEEVLQLYGSARLMGGGYQFAPLYAVVAMQVANQWNTNGNCCVVVGSTFPEELKAVRDIIGDMPILVPGYGAQGGKTEATILNGVDSTGAGLINNVSRSLIFPEDGDIELTAERWDEEFRRCLRLATSQPN